SFLPICEVDAPLFLSAVYNKRYTSEKTTSRCPQSGRSMIEMLGVLAIIGVLSVGGIAGYSKAMMKYRINKTIEQITLIAGNVRAFWGPQKNYIGVDCKGFYCNASGCYGYVVDADGNPSAANNGCPIVKKAKIFPDEMITVTDGKIMSITNPFGYGVGLYAEDKSTGGDKQAFSIAYKIDGNIEACIELLSQDWAEAKNIAVNIYNEGSELDYYFKSLPIPVDKATEKCAEVIESNPDGTQLYFYFDIEPNSEPWKDVDWAD
ncbi:MAG: hypothetical protein IJ525_06745, partial [Alphaproteobacteria bacterium]|nr:hypothetical protein [Alphaproteobacteria bacterium]